LAPGVYYFTCTATVAGSSATSRIARVEIIPQHNISVGSYNYGSVSIQVNNATPVVNNFATPVSAHRDDTITVRLTADSGYVIYSYSILYADSGYNRIYRNTGIGVYEFDMPAADVLVNVTFTEASTDLFDIELIITPPSRGTATVVLDPDVTQAQPTQLITVNIIEDTTSSGTSDFRLDWIAIEGGGIDFTALSKIDDLTYVFPMPEENVTITVNFIEVEKGYVRRQVLTANHRWELFRYQTTATYGAQHTLTIQYRTTSENSMYLFAVNIWWTGNENYSITPLDGALGTWVTQGSWQDGILLPNTNGLWVTETYRINALHHEQGPNDMIVRFTGGGGELGFISLRQIQAPSPLHFTFDFSDWNAYLERPRGSGSWGDSGYFLESKTEWAPPAPTL
jgi:hypothetical protein